MNPIIQAMSLGRPNISSLMSAVKTGNPDILAKQMMDANPQFRQFIEMNKGKSAQQIARENGINYDEILNMLK